MPKKADVAANPPAAKGATAKQDTTKAGAAKGAMAKQDTTKSGAAKGATAKAESQKADAQKAAATKPAAAPFVDVTWSSSTKTGSRRFRPAATS